jgi:hypothetical protein
VVIHLRLDDAATHTACGRPRSIVSVTPDEAFLVTCETCRHKVTVVEPPTCRYCGRTMYHDGCDC